MTRSARDVVHQPLGGYFFCLTCQAPAELDDPGDPNPKCVRAGAPHRELEWRHFEEPDRVARAPMSEAVPEDAQPAVSKPHLPADRRPTLTQRVYEGYLHCQACEVATEKNAEGCCVLCGSGEVVFVPPTVPKEDAA